MFFLLFVIGNLHGAVAIFLYRADLRNNTGTSLNNSAWYVFTLGTENGSHSDFFSN